MTTYVKDIGLVNLMLIFVLIFALSFSWISSGRAEEVFEMPGGGAVFDIWVHDGKVLVPHITQNKLLVLDKNFKQLDQIDMPTPHGVTADSKSNIYIGTHRSGRIVKLDPQLQEIKGWDEELFSSRAMEAPVAVKADTEGNLYVADWLKHRMIKVSEDGKLLLAFENIPEDPGNFQPHGIEIYKDTVYVTDFEHGLIQAFSKEGKFLGSWEKPPGSFTPWTIRLINEQYFLVPSKGDDRIYIFDINGKFLESVEYGGSLPGAEAGPTSLVVDGDWIYYSFYKIGQVQKVSLEKVLGPIRAKAK